MISIKGKRSQLKFKGKLRELEDSMQLESLKVLPGKLFWVTCPLLYNLFHTLARPFRKIEPKQWPVAVVVSTLMTKSESLCVFKELVNNLDAVFGNSNLNIINYVHNYEV